MLKKGQLVSGVVIGHEPYGAFVEIGESEPGALLMDALIDGDELSDAWKSLPPVGSRIVAVFLGYGGTVQTQPRLSIQPSAVPWGGHGPEVTLGVQTGR